MSKWSLLLKAGSRDKNISTCSIHRFSGFENVVPCQRMIWSAFRLHLNSHQVRTVHSVAYLSHLIDTYLEHTVDCTECLVTCAYEQMEHDDDTNKQMQAVVGINAGNSCQITNQIHRLEAIIREGASMGLYRITTLHTTKSTLTAEFFASSSSSSFAPSMKVCEYRVYRMQLPSVPLSPPLQPSPAASIVPVLVTTTSVDGVDGISIGGGNHCPNPGRNLGPSPDLIAGGLSTHHSIYTREKPPIVKVTKAGLLSHQLFGVDNTGMIPSPLSSPLSPLLSSIHHLTYYLCLSLDPEHTHTLTNTHLYSYIPLINAAGNVRVWSSEPLLLHTILHRYVFLSLSLPSPHPLPPTPPLMSR